MSRGVFVFDADRCTGCDACRLACTVENRLAPGVSWRQVFTFNERRHPAAPVFHLSLACNHCERPACMAACPADAYRRDSATGAVVLDPARCIGCGYCAWACPYDAPRFDHDAGVMTKCTFCVERLRAGGAPACASLCPTGALGFERGAVPVPPTRFAGVADHGLGPALRVLPLRPGHERPDGLPAFDGPTAPATAAVPARVTLAREWSLLVFTSLAAALVAWVTAAAAGAPRPPWFVVAAGALVATGAAAAHLGRPERAWRAMLGVRTSWLAREIVAFSAFAVAASLWAAGPAGVGAPGIAAVALGWLALVCVDGVYEVALAPGHVRPHSGEAVPIALGLTTLAAGSAPAALVVGALRLGLYARRLRDRTRAGQRPRVALAVARITFGFAVPLVAWWAGAHALALGAAAIGDLFDRAEFYDGLRFESPQRALAHALDERLRPAAPA